MEGAEKRPSASRRRCCSPAPPRWARSSSRCTGAATATPTTNRWRKPARRAVDRHVIRLRFLESISAVSKTPRRPTSTSAGAPSAALSSHSRLHGSKSYQVPWAFTDDESCDVVRHFTQLKCRMMPVSLSSGGAGQRVARRCCAR